MEIFGEWFLGRIILYKRERERERGLRKRERERGKAIEKAGNTKRGCITVLLTFCLTGLD